MSAEDARLVRMQVSLSVVIRPCVEADLPALEWFGLFESHRELIREVFEHQQRGEALMLVAEVNGAASGQAWGDLSRRQARLAELWAVRVMPCLQGCGIGARLVAVTESLAAECGIETMQVAVETDNTVTCGFYERLGYRAAGTRLARHRTGEVSEQWVLTKSLPR